MSPPFEKEHLMTVVSREIAAPVDQVFAVLADGWSYAGWVVGASRIRRVDDGFPEPGAKIHHSVGTWPLLIDDTTSVIDCDPGRRLELRVRAWPFGEGFVGLTLHDKGATTTVEGDVVVTIDGDLQDDPAEIPTLLEKLDEGRLRPVDVLDDEHHRPLGRALLPSPPPRARTRPFPGPSKSRK